MNDFSINPDKYSLLPDSMRRTKQAADSMEIADTGKDMSTYAPALMTASRGGSAADVASTAMLSHGLESGNPYIIAAAAGLGTISGAIKKRGVP